MRSYHLLFDYISVVCDKKHLDKVRLAVPVKTGLIICDESGVRVKRSPKKNNKQNSLVMLDTIPAQRLRARFGKNAKSKFELCEKVRESHSASYIRAELLANLLEKFGRKTSLFISETEGVVMLDDFYALELEDEQII